MKIIVTIRKLDNRKEKTNLKYKSEWIFYTLLCGEDFKAQIYNIRGALQIFFPTKRV